jgi:hypothetical protein
VDEDFLAEQIAIADKLRSEPFYLGVRVLEDGSIAILQRLITTYSIATGCDDFSWKRRFCFDDPAIARAQFAKIKGEDDFPDGWIACRPEVREEDTGKYVTPEKYRRLYGKSNDSVTNDVPIVA